MSEDSGGLGATGRSLLARISYYTSPWRPWAPASALALAYLAHRTGLAILRGVAAVAALILFLLVSVDAARSFWEVDHGPWDPRRYLSKARISPFQIVLAAALALIYVFSIMFLIASFLILPSWWVFLAISPFVLVAAGLVAWHNVRLWAFQSIEYEEMLKDEQQVQAENERVKQMRTNQL
ncbi:MAG TPA: hypothetical protein VIB39_03935 [Candidatus Angelobacter sp.]